MFKIAFVFNYIEYKAGIEAGFFKFKMEDLEKAKKSEGGFVGEMNGEEYYLSLNIKCKSN